MDIINNNCIHESQKRDFFYFLYFGFSDYTCSVCEGLASPLKCPHRNSYNYSSIAKNLIFVFIHFSVKCLEVCGLLCS